MALISIIEDFHPLNNARLLDRAAELVQPLHHHVKEPVGGFKLKERYSPEKNEIILDIILYTMKVYFVIMILLLIMDTT